MSSGSQLGYTPALALFEKPSVNTGVLSHKWIEYRPISQITDSGIIEFNIPGTSNSYINLKCSTLQIKGKIVKEDGSKITDSDWVSLTNIPLHSIWNQVDITLQNTQISQEVGPNYAYKAYLDMLLTTNNDVRFNQYSSQLLAMDASDQMDAIDPAMGGMYLRQTYTAKSKEIQIEGPLYLDLCQQDKYIINMLPIKLKLWSNKPTFYLMSNDTSTGFTFKITDATLKVCTVNVSPGILLGHAAGLNYAPAIYPFFQSNLKAFNISQGALQYTQDDIFQGNIPSEIIVGLISAEAYSGNYRKNPFNFYHYNCSFCGFYVDGVSVPKDPLQPKYKLSSIHNKNKNGRRAADAETGETETPEEEDTESEAYTDAFLSLFGHDYNTLDTIPITLRQYPNGFCLYRFQITDSTEDDEMVSFTRRGNARLVLKFRKALEENVIVLIYARFPKVMQIDKTRNVIL